MVAPDYAAARSNLAKNMGLGRRVIDSHRSTRGAGFGQALGEAGESARQTNPESQRLGEIAGIGIEQQRTPCRIALEKPDHKTS